MLVLKKKDIFSSDLLFDLPFIYTEMATVL